MVSSMKWIVRLLACLISFSALASEVPHVVPAAFFQGAINSVVSGSDPTFTFPCDSWTGCTAAFSWRKVRSAYVGSAFKAFRTSDNSAQDIGFTAHGNPDLTSLNSFCTFGVINASITSTTLTINSVVSGSVHAGSYIFDQPQQGVPTSFYVRQPTKITSGGSSTWTVNVSQTVASENMMATDCFMETWYNQIGSGSIDLSQTTQANMFAIIGSGAPLTPSSYGSVPAVYSYCQYNSLTCAGTFMSAPDSATYKTTAVDMFLVAALGTNRAPLNQPPYAPNGTTAAWFVGYPINTNTPCGWGPGASFPNPEAHPWVFAQSYAVDSYVPQGGSGNGTSNQQGGFGHSWANYLYQWDVNWDTTSSTYVNGFLAATTNAPVAPITYPNAVGLYVGASSDGACAATTFFDELILYGSTQASRASIAANQSSYWGISAPPTTFVENSFTFTPQYYDKFFLPAGGNQFQFCMDSTAPGGCVGYVSETMFYPWSVALGATSAGHDLVRYSVHTNNDDTIGNSSPSDRSEQDANYQAQVTNATASWTTSSTTISTVATNGGSSIGQFFGVAGGETLYDMTTGQLIGTVSSYTGTTVTLTTTAAHASSGSADVLFFSTTNPAQSPSALCPGGFTCQVSYAVQWQTGFSSPSPNGMVSWNTHGQGHYLWGTFPPAWGGFDLGAASAAVDTLSFTGDGPGSPTLLWTASSPITRGAWYYVFLQFMVSPTRTSPTDVMKVWVRGPGIGSGTAYTQILNLGPGLGSCTTTCNLFPSSNTSGSGGTTNAGWTHWKIGEYRGNSLGDPISITGTDVVYYCNLQTAFNPTSGLTIRDLSNYVISNTPPTVCVP